MASNLSVVATADGDETAKEGDTRRVPLFLLQKWRPKLLPSTIFHFDPRNCPHRPRLVSATKHENRDATAIFSQSHLSLPDLAEMWVTLARSMAELSPLLKVVLMYLDMVVPSPVLKGGFSITIYLFGGKPLQGQK